MVPRTRSGPLTGWRAFPCQRSPRSWSSRSFLAWARARRSTRSAFDAQARQVLEDARLTLAPRAVDVRLTEGVVRERLLQTAEEWKADLIVLGARGLSGVERALLGSVSLSVAREARCAVMIVKGAAKSLQRVVVGLDGSEHSRHALSFMASLPLTADTELVLVGVAEKTHLPRSAPASLPISFAPSSPRSMRRRRPGNNRSLSMPNTRSTEGDVCSSGASSAIRPTKSLPWRKRPALS